MKVLVYGFQGWIGQQFVNLLIEKNINFVNGNCRVNSIEDVNKEIIEKGLTVRQTEELIRKMNQAGKNNAFPSATVTNKNQLSPVYKKLEDKLTSHLSTKVTMQLSIS